MADFNNIFDIYTWQIVLDNAKCDSLGKDELWNISIMQAGWGIQIQTRICLIRNINLNIIDPSLLWAFISILYIWNDMVCGEHTSTVDQNKSK